MVYQPTPWGVKEGSDLRDGGVPSIFDMEGGYLTQPGGELMNRYRD